MEREKGGKRKEKEIEGREGKERKGERELGGGREEKKTRLLGSE